MGKDMNRRTLKVIFAKDGKGNVTPKISLPISWLRDMGITDIERGIDLEYDEKNKVFFAVKEGVRKDVNLTYNYDEENKVMILKKKYESEKTEKYIQRRKEWKKSIKIKGYKKFE